MTGQWEPGTPSQTVGPDMSRLPTFKPLVVSTYNVRTLHQQGKTHQLFTGCSDAGVDIVGVQEHRLITSSPTDELWSDDKNWVLIYSSATDQRQGGVGLLMSRHIHRCLQSVQTINQRILTASFNGNPQLTVTIIYAPTESATSGEKDSFYNPLEDHLEKVKRHNIHLVIGDFNARIGQDSHVSHPAVVGPHCFYDTTNDNGERLVNLCQEFKLRPSQPRFPQPKSRLWTWMHPTDSKHQLDHILVNSKWVNSLRNCRAYNSVELDSDHRILSIRLHTSLRTTKGKPCKRPKYNWKKLLHAPTKNRFQIELSNRFQVLQCDDNDQSPISERYEMFEKVVEEVAEEVVGKCSPCGMPSWVTDKTLKLRSERDAAKKRYLLVRTHHAREVWRKLNTQLNESYRADELASIHRQMEDLQVANENGNYNTTWKIIHDISGKKKRSNPKVKKRDGTIPSSDKELLAEWKDYFCALLNNDNGPPTSDLPPPAVQDLPICADPLPWKRQERPFKQ
ncbi:craniofacial development protein 2-like [Amphiura filiformis]|uniref:craniofacial development protein 2-like n=1 Tax=Amphiura filiformis TaxID=82378 RepID=UPI003B2208C1